MDNLFRRIGSFDDTVRKLAFAMLIRLSQKNSTSLSRFSRSSRHHSELVDQLKAELDLGSKRT